MIDNLISGGIGMIAGMFIGFMIAVLLVSAKSYDSDKYEEYEDDNEI